MVDLSRLNQYAISPHLDVLQTEGRLFYVQPHSAQLTLYRLPPKEKTFVRTLEPMRLK